MKQIFLKLIMVFVSMNFGGEIIKANNSKNSSSDSKINVIIIYTDQQRYNTIHSLGNNEIITPNLDKLVSGGTAFTHSFVSSPVCTPSRWSLHTGMYTTSHKTYSNHHHAKVKPIISLPGELKKNGYKTVLLGKNHSFLGKKQMDIIWKGNKFEKVPKDGRSAKEAMPWKEEDDPMYTLTSKAIDVLKENMDQPVFMWLSYLYPHTPYMCPEPYFSMYDSVDLKKPVLEPDGLKKAGKPFRQVFHMENTNRFMSYNPKETMRMKKTYYGMISMIDSQVGRLMDYLDENGLRDNTLIIFTSDHGDYMGDHGLYTKSPSMYDCLTRVPLIFNWSGQIKPNHVSNELVSNVDIMPSILDLLNCSIPEQVQGMSLSEVLKGNRLTKSREYIYSEYGIPGEPLTRTSLEKELPDYKENPIYYHNKEIPWEANPVSLSGRFRMIRSHKFKLVKEEKGEGELYDLQHDPNELINQWDNPKYKDEKIQMLQALDSWKKNLPGIECDTLNMGKVNLEKYLNRKKRNKGTKIN